MYRLILLLLLPILPQALFSQTDSISLPAAISNARRSLLQAFENDDRLQAQRWLDSLRRLEDGRNRTLEWDERWLFYLWLENYSPMFSEVRGFTRGMEMQSFYQSRPPEDSLFIRLDTRLFKEQAYLFDQIRKSALNPEERAFATLLLNYLLRLSTGEQAEKAFDDQLNGFLKQYPNSTFKPFIRARMYNKLPPSDYAVGIDLLFLNGNWSDGLERSFRPFFGVDMAFLYWRKRMNAAFRFAIGGQKLSRDVVENGYVWPEKDGSTFIAVELEGGYDLYNRAKLRIFPSLGGGVSSLHPPEEEDNPNPDYYDHFKFHGWHLVAAIQADVKLGSGQNNVTSSYHGLRVRIGRRWLKLSADNPAIQGNMFFFAVGYTIFGRQAR
ncbi:MAG: hypothetical protein IPH12_09040 [Saprospirales bacterium]|nr:hypothetical protein [Saprospirales bacterium]MBK8920980.1 hypothetical protein [Saprospirales bacterium]